MKMFAAFLSVCALMGLSTISWAEKGKTAKCPISGKDVSKDVSVEINGEKKHFCCKGCVKPFLTKVIKLEDKGADKCVISGRPAKAETGVIHKTAKKVAFCCNNCQQGYMKKNSLVAKTVEK